MLLSPEKKLVECMMELFCKLCKEKEMVLDTFTVTLAAAKACFLLHVHHRFVVCEKYSSYFQDVAPSQVNVCAEYVSNPDYDVAGSEEAVEI